MVDGISKTIDGVKLLDKVSFTLNRGDRVVFIGENELAQTTLFRILMGELEPGRGQLQMGLHHHAELSSQG